MTKEEFFMILREYERLVAELRRLRDEREEIVFTGSDEELEKYEIAINITESKCAILKDVLKDGRNSFTRSELLEMKKEWDGAKVC